ncbi:hypothetical protein Tco_0818571 [Tanacetum coccineum]
MWVPLADTWRQLSNDSLPRDGGSDVSLSAGADNDWYEVAEVAANDWYEVSADQWESATCETSEDKEVKMRG